MFTTTRYEASIPVEEYIDGYVNVDEFLQYCKQCHNYNQSWSCPPYDFDVLAYWKKYKKLDLVAVEIIFDEEYANHSFSPEELRDISAQSLWKVKQELTEELYQRETDTPDSISLSAGSCMLCEKCTRPDHAPCRFPDKLRYSIEALGGNVGLTLSKLMGIELEWVQDGILPSRFVLVCGLLSSKRYE